MATIKQRPNGTWRCEIIRVGYPYQTQDGFKTRREAQRWAAKHEFALIHNTRKTLYDAFSRYLESVSTHKRSERWETNCVARFKEQLPDRQLSSFTSDKIAKWRDDRLKTVSTGTVRREMNLFGAILETATVEWGWLEANPFRKVKRPPDGQARRRVVTEGELEAFVEACRTPHEIKCGKAFAFAVETGMRAGEIVGIRFDHISDKTVILPRTKNGDERRVPLSTKARQLLPANGFELTSSQLDIHFRNVRDRLNQDYTFHAARHTAATRIGQSGKLTPYELCAMFGWRDLKMALRYSHTSVTDIADRL